MRQTPALRWDPIPNAGCYTLYLSRDAEMTNPVANFVGISVESNQWMATSALFEGQAGSAFFWKVTPARRGRPGRLTGPAARVQQAVQPDRGALPGNGATVQDDVTFTWRDFLATNLDPAAWTAPG